MKRCSKTICRVSWMRSVRRRVENIWCPAPVAGARSDDAESGNRLFDLRGRFPEKRQPGTGICAPDDGADHAAEQSHGGRRVSFWQPFVSLAWRFAATPRWLALILLTYTVRGRGTVANGGWPPWARRQLQDILLRIPRLPPANQDEVLMMVAGNRSWKTLRRDGKRRFW